MAERRHTVTRKTRETDITLTLDLDGGGTSKIATGIGFFDHMLNSFATHSGSYIELACTGDLDVDCHHTIEDVGIVLGKAFAAILEKSGSTARFGEALVPMDEALARCVLDTGGRAYLVFDADFSGQIVGGFDTGMAKEFFRAVAFNAGFTLHLCCLYGGNDHHIIEAMFKAFARAWKKASLPAGELLSTKGGEVLSV